MGDIERRKEFGLALIGFYKEFLLGTSKSVQLLAGIEKRYPKEYEIIKQLKDDPQAISELSEKHLGAGWYQDNNGKKFRLGAWR